MRGVLVVVLCLSSAAAAERLDPMKVRPDLKRVRSTGWETKNGKLVETERNTWTYDARGHVLRMEKRERGKVTSSAELTWDADGRMVSSTHRDRKGRKTVRHYAYKVDANGRITEITLRDPSTPAGELIRYEYTWGPDGSHTEQAFRHYPKEGPYPYGSEQFDAQGRRTRTCREHGGCTLYEYTAQGDVRRLRHQTADGHMYQSYENTYDSAGRLVTQVVGGQQSDYAYDARGEVESEVIRRIAAQGGEVLTKVVYTYDYR